MATAKDLTKLQHVYVDGPLHFYYEQAADDTRTLRHIRVNQRTYNVPADATVNYEWEVFTDTSIE
ncbi:MAG: hypothetical protein IJ647_02480 [Prevotella sp.]|nr:hypothetical protein [Prevotella sp.]